MPFRDFIPEEEKGKENGGEGSGFTDFVPTSIERQSIIDTETKPVISSDIEEIIKEEDKDVPTDELPEEVVQPNSKLKPKKQRL